MGKASRDKGARYEDMTLPGEEWRPVAGFACYEVSNLGRIRATEDSLAGARIRRQRQKRNGYREVNLFDREASRYRFYMVHRLVLLAFVGPPAHRLMHACHINGDRADNRLENLRWATAKENAADKIEHGTALFGGKTNSAKLTPEQVRIIRQARERNPGFHWGAGELARRFGVHHTTIARVASGQWWGHVGS